MWSNLNTNQEISVTGIHNTTNFTVTGLSGDANYNVSVAAVNMCGIMTSDPVTVYGEYHSCICVTIYIIILYAVILNNKHICI